MGGWVVDGRSDAVEGEIAERPKGAQASYALCIGREETDAAMQVGVEAGFHNLANLDARLDLNRRARVTQHDVVLVVFARSSRHLRMNQPTLKKGLPHVNYFGFPRIRDNEYSAFRSQFGDRWVSELEVGTEFVGYYKFHSVDRSVSQDIVGKLNASGIVGGGKAEGHLQVVLNDVVSSSSVTVSSDCKLVGVGGVPLPDADAFISFARDLSTLDGPGEILNVRLSDYGTVGLQGAPSG